MAKNIRYFQGKHYQGNLSDVNSATILELINKYDKVTSLKHCIYNLTETEVTDLIELAEEYEANNGTLKGFEAPKGEKRLGELRDAQTVGVAFMYYAGSCILGDEVGLGKTVQIAGLANILNSEKKKVSNKPFRFLFLGEKSTVGQLRSKLVQFTGEYVGLLANGEQKNVEKYIVKNPENEYYSVVGTHSLLDNPLFIAYMLKNPFDLVIIDESSILKNTSHTYYQNVKQIFKYVERKVLLNATPLENNLREFYNQLDLLDNDYMPYVGEFMNRYARTERKTFGYEKKGFKNEEEFRELIKLRYLARTRMELGAKYENNFYRTVLVPLSETQKQLLKKTSMKQMTYDYPKGVKRDIPFTFDTTPKLAALMDILYEHVWHKKEQALVYCRYVDAQKDIAEILGQEGYTCAILNGDRKLSVKKRQDIITKYNNGEIDIIITNVLKGLDLNTCDISIAYTIDTNAQKLRQFEGRMTREFDVIGKSFYLLVSMGDEKKFVETELKLRVNTSDAMTTTGNSLVLDAIKKADNIEVFDIEQM